MNKSLVRLKGFDGLRGLLACAVAYNHASGHLIGWESRRYVLNPSYAVDVFFAMSGIVLFYAYGKSCDLSIKGFLMLFVRRFFRLYPVYLFSLMLIMAIFWLRTGVPYPSWIGAQGFNDYFKNFTLLGYIGSMGYGLWNDPGWSIAIELWIGTVVAFISFRLKPSLCIFLGIGSYSWFLFSGTTLNMTAGPVTLGIINPAELRCIGGMLCGLGFWRILEDKIPLLSNNLRETFINIGMCAIIIPILLPTLTASPSILLPCLLLAIFGVAILPFSKAAVWEGLEGKFLKELGGLSFLIYLLHVPVIFLLLPLKNISGVHIETLPFIAMIITVLISKAFSFIENMGVGIGRGVLQLLKK